MDPANEEEVVLGAAALQNANAILLARRSAEDGLVRATEALERKTRELAHSLSLVRATLESTTDGILVTDAHGLVTGCNQKYLRMWRVERERVEGQEYSRLTEATVQQIIEARAYQARIREIYDSGPPETFEVIEFHDGRVFERYSNVQQVDARVVGRVWSFRDITERRRAERELREQSEWFRVALGSIGDAVITVDLGSQVTFLNSVAEKLTGWQAVEAHGQLHGNVIKLVNEITREPVVSPIERALTEGIVVGLANHTTLIGRAGAEFPIEDSAAPIKNADGKIIGAVMVFHDISERRERERILAGLYETGQRARQAADQANQAKDKFIAHLSHELRTPLTPALAVLANLREKATLPEDVLEDLETVRRNVELEARLIDDLLDLTRITRGKLELHREQIPIPQLIENAISTCQTELAARRLLLTREMEATQTIFADSARLTQILWNLLRNAIKFTSAGGKITVRSRVKWAGHAEQLVIEIQDTGRGMDPERLDHMFEPFEQGGHSITREFGGLGLGLAISRAIAEAHRGTLTAASEGVGLGSTLTLTLPLNGWGELGTQISDLDTGQASLPLVYPPPSPRPVRILLVEDHIDTAAILARLLRRSGYDVITSATVAEALEVAARETRGAGIDLVMSDLGLPDGSGLDLMRTLSTNYGLRGIALSGFGMESDLEQSTAAGFSRHLIKPIDITIMRRTIAEMIASK